MGKSAVDEGSVIEPLDQYRVALSLWTLALQFLSLVDNAARETAARGNKWVVTSDHPIDEHYYEEETRWSDHAIIAPTIFNLLHGLELLVKGFLVARGVAIRKEHKISRLRQMFSHEFPNEADLNNFVANTPHWTECLQSSGISSERTLGLSTLCTTTSGIRRPILSRP